MNSIEIVSKAAEKEDLTHAYLAPVRAGTSLKSYATELGKEILCSPGDETCSEKVIRDTHPDFVMVDVLNNKTKISISQVEEIISSSSYSPIEGERKLYVINRVEDLSREGANSLLKILEDPPKFVYFLLLTESPNSLLPTIISRCQQLPTGGTSIEGMKDLLYGKGFEEKEVGYLVRVVNYRATLLDDLLEDGTDGALEEKEKLEKEYEEASLIDLSEGLIDSDNYIEKDVLARLIFSRVEASSNRQLIESAEKLAKLNQEDLELLLEKGLNIYRNDYRAEVAEGSFTPGCLGRVRIIDRAIESLPANVNVQLLLESTLLKLAVSPPSFNRRSGV